MGRWANDCAVLKYGEDKDVLVTTDLLMEGVHFDLTYLPMKHLGYKAAMVNLSDIYAMGGMPKQITAVSLALSKRFSIEDYGTTFTMAETGLGSTWRDIVGGDTIQFPHRTCHLDHGYR